MDTELYLLGTYDDMTVSTMMIVEGTENKRPGVLCEVEGPFIVLAKENNNDRWYTKSLIDNRILGIPYTKKMLANKTLYGEASHPSDRFDVKLPLISHNITSLWYNEDQTVLMGRADVLDTPSGRIIYTLVQYGSKIGISVRARGRLIEKNGKRIPDESVYQFKTFDFVPNPGFDEARMNRVDESVEDDLATTFKEYVANASVADLSCIQSIFEAADDEIFGDVKQIIKERMSENTLPQTTELDESVTEILYEEAIASDNRILDLEEQVESLETQLNEATKDKASLEEQVSTLKVDLANKIKDIDDLSGRLMDLLESESAFKADNDKLLGRVKKLTSALKGYRSEVSEMVDRLEESEQEVRSLEKKQTRALRRLDEAQDMVEELEDRLTTSIQRPEVSKKKVLPQGKTQVLNESVVDTPIVTEKVENFDGRRRSFIQKCSL